VYDYLKPKNTGFEPNQYRNFGFEKSSGIFRDPGIPVLKALMKRENFKSIFLKFDKKSNKYSGMIFTTY
jgi:hypothetical protein